MYNKTYLQLVKDGIIKDKEEINDFINFYWESDSVNKTMSLQEYLGLSPSLYNLYLHDFDLFFYTVSSLK